MLSKKSDETQPDGNAPSGTERCISTELAAKLAVAETCPKWNQCSAAYCPALGPRLGGKPYAGERVCSYLLESVKDGGQARLRASLPSLLAEAVVKDSLRLRNSAGVLQKPLERASKLGSRMESMRRAAGFRRSSRD